MKKFKPPTIEEVKKFAMEIGFATLDAGHWWHFYNSKNWMVGKNKMVVWKSAVQTWFRKSDEYRQQQQRKAYAKAAKPVAVPRDKQITEDERKALQANADKIFKRKKDWEPKTANELAEEKERQKRALLGVPK